MRKEWRERDRERVIEYCGPFLQMTSHSFTDHNKYITF